MKSILPLLLICPLISSAQTDSVRIVFPNTKLPKPYGDTLKPIDFREIPYTYTTSSTSTYRGHTSRTYSTHTGIKRIYSYDGIDVDNPEKELWRYLDAVNDPDIDRLRLEFDDITARQRENHTVGAFFWVPGIVMFIVGSVQAINYREALRQKQQAYNSAPVGPSYITKTCMNWSGYSDGKGGYTWTCSTDPTITYTGIAPPLTVQVPVNTPRLIYPTTVDQPKGAGWGITGLCAMLLGAIIGASTSGNPHSTFLKAVQYYNRALKQKFSWEVGPFSNYNSAGIRITGHF